MLGEPGSPEFIQSYIEALDGTPTTPFHERKRQRERSIFARSLASPFKSAKKRASENGREFSLDFDVLLKIAAAQRYRCALTQIPFDHKRRPDGRRNPYAVSIDRIDCSKGYTPDNTRLVLFGVNVMLLDWGTETLDHIALEYVKARGISPTPARPAP